MQYDVVVAGGGTAGAYVSYLLSKAGFKVALLESKSGRNSASRHAATDWEYTT